jgi:hypothetical protein
MPKIAALGFRLASISVLALVDARTAKLSPVHSNDPNDPNKSFAKFMPKADFEFSITNPDAFDFLEPGATYDIVMVRHDSGHTIQVLAPPAGAGAVAPLDLPAQGAEEGAGTGDDGLAAPTALAGPGAAAALPEGDLAAEAASAGALAPAEGDAAAAIDVAAGGAEAPADPAATGAAQA